VCLFNVYLSLFDFFGRRKDGREATVSQLVSEEKPKEDKRGIKNS